jgi:DMSO/TMAO reductase YedYZ molybdopterin-dependent catalytic subunit
MTSASVATERAPGSRVRAVRWWPAALAGIAGAAVAIGASELLAGLVAGVPSLVTAIGELVISLQPPGAKDVMVELFGTADKLALNAIVVIAALGIAAIAGIVAARSWALGAAIFIAFGAVAAIAAARSPLASPLVGILSAALATGVGLLVLRALLGLTPQPTDVTAPTAVMPDWERRRFLIASGAALGGAVAAGAVGRALVEGQHPQGVVTSSRLPSVAQAAAPLNPDNSIQVTGITPLVIPNDGFYKIDTALLVPRVDSETWSVSVTGMVDRPLTFTYDQLLAMPLFEQYVTIACVSNQVGGNLVGNALWTGVRLKEILQQAGVQAGATQIIGRSVDGFTAGFPTEWALAPEREPMIAVGMNREPLPAAHGFPARLIVPGLYGYVSATKWLSEIELTTREAIDGYWVPLGWAKDAPILTQSRIDVPGSGDSVAAGDVEVAGVAWAPDRGIESVEVSIDEGAWAPARISRPVSDATWVQWAFTWPASPGSHSIDVRAIDGTGEVQTDQRSAPAPDGARGHHRVTVAVA